jgi:hypothetical protein
MVAPLKVTELHGAVEQVMLTVTFSGELAGAVDGAITNVDPVGTP